jgi:EAL domain-containing protein (putative c-di-GMP-specific phosphodiesterase class I)
MFPTTGTPRTYTDPVATQEFADALEASARRAAALVVEARQERQAQHDKAVEDLVRQLRSDGLPEYFRIGVGDFSEQNDRVRARTGVGPRHCAASFH